MPVRRLTAALAIAAASLTVTVNGVPELGSPADATAAGAVASWCRPDTSPAQLDRMFDGDPGRMVGADYPRTLRLPDGRVLWTFQDPVVGLPSGGTRNLHNAAVVQTGNCFELLRSGSDANPGPWLLAGQTTPERTWFWPMASTLSTDERTVHVFLAKMRENSAGGYLVNAVPQSVVVVNLDAITLAVTGGPFTPSWGTPTGLDPTLYGWSAETAGNWTYLFGHCHRQFGFDPFFNDTFIHDSSCARQIRLARVPRGEVFAPLQYWTGSAWSSDRNAATSLFAPTRATLTQPSQFHFVNGRWMAVTKLDDWWGEWIVVDQADKVTGPWRQTAWIRALPKCPRVPPNDPGCNTYFAGFVDQPTRTVDDAVVISLSHNLWSGQPSSLYRPTYLAIDPPLGTAALADRCALNQC